MVELEKNGLNRTILRGFFILLIVILTSISMVSSFEFDNSKDYNPETKTATITNAFGFGDTIAEITLDTPQVNYVIRGKDRLIAQFTIDNKEAYDNAFNDLSFYYKNDNMRKFGREYDYKYLDDKDKWKKLNHNLKLTKGIITIGIFTDVYAGDEVEWIPELFGVEINEWAIWTESLDVGLTSYWDFNGTGTNLPNLVNPSKNGTASGAITWVTDGLIGKASNHSVDYFFNVTTNVWNVGGNNSLSLWFNVQNNASIRYMFGTFPSDDIFSGMVYEVNSQIFVGGDDTGLVSQGDMLDRWTHLAISQEEGGDADIYYNGALWKTIVSTSVATNKNLIIGGSYVGGSMFSGKLDEFGIWNRTLSADEVTQLFNGGDGITYNVSDIETTLNSPANDSEFLVKSIGFVGTFNSSDNPIKNTTLYIWNSTNNLYATNFTSITGIGNSTNLSITFTNNDTYKWNYESCNIINQCKFAELNRTFTSTHIIVNNETWENITTEGNQETFEINFTTSGSQITVANLIYNGTTYTGTLNIDGNNYRVTRTLEIPTVTTEEEINFNWLLKLQNGFVKNTTQRIQNITNIGIDDCTSYNVLIANLTLKDEISQNILTPPATENTTIEIDLNLFTPTGTKSIINFSQNYTYINPASICLSQINSSRYRMDAIIKYNSRGRFTEFYHIQNYTLTNSTLGQNISLYDLNLSLGQEFKLTYKDNNFNVVPNALVQVQRQYINEGVFKTVEIPKISNTGYTILHLIPSNVVYNFIIIKNGVVLDSFNNVVANCQTPDLKDCEININNLASTVSPADFDLVGEFSSTLTYDDTTRLISSTYAITSGVSAVTTLNVTLFSPLGTTNVCTNSLEASGGTLSCTVPLTFQNSTVVVRIISGGDEKRFAMLNLESDPDDIYGNNLIFFALMLMVLLIGIGITDNPMVLGVMMFFGMILLVALNVLNSDWLGSIGTGMSLLWLLIAIIIILVKGSNRQ